MFGEFFRGDRKSRRDVVGHQVASPTNRNLADLRTTHLKDYAATLETQIENEGSLNPGRTVALTRAKEKLEEELSRRGLL